METMNIKQGDTIKINAIGRTFEGTVLTADFYNGYGWYIEFTSTNGTYHYWKQRDDGGKLLEVNGKTV